MRFSRRTRTTVAALVLLTTGSAAAQGTPTVQEAQLRDEARARFERGVAYIQSERWADAITELQRARELRATPAVLYNLGLASRAVGRNRDVMATFREFVRGASEGTNPELMSRARSYLRELAAGLGRLDLQVDPPVARVLVDGTVVLIRLGLEVDAGRHVVVAEADGYAAQTQTVDVLRGAHQSLSLRLVPIAARSGLTVHPAPSALVAPRAERGRSRSVLESPWLWIGIGVVAVGAGVATYLVLREGTPAYQGSFGTVTDALTLGRWP